MIPAVLLTAEWPGKHMSSLASRSEDRLGRVERRAEITQCDRVWIAGALSYIRGAPASKHVTCRSSKNRQKREKNSDSSVHSESS